MLKDFRNLFYKKRTVFVVFEILSNFFIGLCIEQIQCKLIFRICDTNRNRSLFFNNGRFDCIEVANYVNFVVRYSATFFVILTQDHFFDFYNGLLHNDNAKVIINALNWLILFFKNAKQIARILKQIIDFIRIQEFFSFFFILTQNHICNTVGYDQKHSMLSCLITLEYFELIPRVNIRILACNQDG